MLKRNIFLLIWLLVIFLLAASPALAQEDQSLEEGVIQEQEESENQADLPEEEEAEPKKELKAVAGEDKSVAVSRSVVFDASKSINSDESLELRYYWELGDGTEKEGIDVTHSYDRPGFYQVNLRIDNGQEQDTDELIVSVYEDLVVLISDNSVSQDKTNSLKRYAARQGILLVSITDTTNNADYIVEDSLVKSMLESSQDLAKADILISWTSAPSLGLNALSKYGKQSENIQDIDLTHKGIVVISEKNSFSISRIAQSTFDVLGPEYILLTQSDALEAVIDARESEEVVEAVHGTQVDYNLIGVHSERAVKELGFTNFLSYTVNFLINKGVAAENITLILLLPVVATLIALARQFLGVKTFGIYIPSLISLTFVVTGLKYGLFIFVVLLASATLMRLILKRFRFLYLPRMALVLTVMAFVLLALLVLGSVTNRTGIIALSIFPVLVLIILVEKFIEVQIEKGFLSALALSLETILVSIVCYFIISWESLKTFVIAYPEVILLTLVVNILVGKWVGLRVSEYIRFRELNRATRKKEST